MRRNNGLKDNDEDTFCTKLYIKLCDELAIRFTLAHLGLMIQKGKG